MAKRVAQMGGTTAQVEAYIGIAKQIVVDTDTWRVYLMDGKTAGGFAVAMKSDLNAYMTTAQKASLVAKSGDRGALAGFEDCTTSAAAITISGTSPETQIVNAAVSITIANGTAAKAYTKNVFIKDAGATVSPGSAWKWVGGKVPEMKVNSLLVAKWCGDVGILSLVTTE